MQALAIGDDSESDPDWRNSPAGGAWQVINTAVRRSGGTPFRVVKKSGGSSDRQPRAVELDIIKKI
jgi:hypothetical protein